MRWHWFVLGLGAAAAGAAAWRGLWEADQLTLREEALRFPELPAAFDGFRIAQVSDLHLPRPPVPGESDGWRGARVAALVRAAGVDVIAVTGDLVKSRRQDGGPAALELLTPIAPTYVIPGNEDYQVCEDDLGLDFDDTLARWTETGATVLRNTATAIEREGEALWIAGTDDPHTRREDLDATFADIPAGAFVVLLAHSPDVVLDPQSARARLILSGHTHGGQVCLPNGTPLYTHSYAGRAYGAGLVRVRGSVLSVSRGIGSVNIPVRLFCLPEVVVLELKRG